MNAPQKSRTVRTMLLAVLAFLGGAAAVLFLQRRRQKFLQDSLANLQREQDTLREESAELQAQLLAPPSPVLTVSGSKPHSWLNTLLLVLILLLAAVGPAGEDKEEEVRGGEDELHSDRIAQGGSGGEGLPRREDCNP